MGEDIKVGKVGIIGGGNTTVDAARAAYRLKGTEKSLPNAHRRTEGEMRAYKEEVDRGN